jgi:hypothetical protein
MKTLLRFILLLLSSQLVFSQLSQAPLRRFWNTDGPIYCMTEINGLIYVGGSFGYVGPYTGNAAAVETGTGALIPNFPIINGIVTSVISDGSEGWFVAGGFTTVGGFPRTNLVHILNDLTVSPTIYPPVLGGINTLVLSGSQLILGGSFTLNTSAGQRQYLAAVNAFTGAENIWAPNPPGAVTSIALYNDRIYASSGHGIMVGNLASAGIRYLPQFFGGSVSCLHVDGQVLYVGGQFRDINGIPHGSAAAINLPDEQLSNWNPLPNSFSPFVTSILGAGSTLFVGSISFINAYDSLDGSLKWSVPAAGLSASAGGAIAAIVLHNDILYIAGDFQTIDGFARRRLAALKPENGAVLPWFVHASSWINTISVSPARIIAGGNLTSMGGLLRTNFAAFDISTGAATTWAPYTDGPVTAMEKTTSALFVGGQFTSINGANLYCLAALDPQSGTNLPFNADLGHSKYPSRVPLYALAKQGDTIFVGGSFTSIFGVDQKYLASFNATTFQMNSSWKPILTSSFLDGGVTRILPHGNSVFTVGFFDRAGDQARTNLAAIDLETGLPLDWNPKVFGFASGEPLVRNISILDSTMYLCGPFSSIGGISRPRAAAISLITGLPLDWSLGAIANTRCFLIQPVENSLFVSLETPSFETRDLLTGVQTGWFGKYPAVLSQLIASNHGLFAAGNAGLAVYESPPTLELPAITNPSTLSIQTFPGQRFKIDASGDLANWINLTSGDSSLKNFTDQDSASFSNRFYRVTQVQN